MQVLSHIYLHLLDILKQVMHFQMLVCSNFIDAYSKNHNLFCH
jgi:hypothetical protein